MYAKENEVESTNRYLYWTDIQEVTNNKLIYRKEFTVREKIKKQTEENICKT